MSGPSTGGVRLDALPDGAAREALRLLGGQVPGNRSAAVRELRATLAGPGTVRSVLERAPDGARDVFVRLAQDGPAPVEALLGRGWWGRGLLPPPLDWLQRRALVAVGDDGDVHPVAEARDGFLDLTLALAPPEPGDAGGGVHVEPAGCALVAADPGQLDRALAVPAAGLRAVAPTVAVSSRTAAAVTAALRAAGVRLDDDAVVAADRDEQPLPGTAEDAVGPRAVRALLARAVDEGRQIRLRYFAGSRGGAATDRVVDPWGFGDDLLRGWCHLRDGERTFAVDRIGHARLLPSGLEHTPPS